MEEQLSRTELLKQYLDQYLEHLNFEPPAPLKYPEKPIVIDSIEEYDEYLAEYLRVSEINTKFQCQVTKSNNAVKEMKQKIYKILPKNVWVKVSVKSGEYAVGVTTSDWGGGVWSLLVRSLSNISATDLDPLEHQISRL